MAGHASGWVKVGAGPMKGRRVFISKAVQEFYGKDFAMDALEDGGAKNAYRDMLSMITQTQPGGQAKAALPKPSAPTPAAPQTPNGFTTPNDIFKPSTGGDPVFIAAGKAREAFYAKAGTPMPVGPDSEPFFEGGREGVVLKYANQPVADLQDLAAQTKTYWNQLASGKSADKFEASLKKDYRASRDYQLEIISDAIRAVKLKAKNAATAAAAAKASGAPGVSGVSWTWGGGSVKGVMPIFSFTIGKSNSATLFADGQNMEMRMDKASSAFANAFAARFGATVKPWKNTVAPTGGAKGLVISWPNGRKDWPDANELAKWLKGTE